MVLDSEYPICEFDTGRDPLIRPADFLAKTLPEKCVITFFRRELEELVRENQLPVLDRLHSEVLDIPIYGYPLASETIAVTMPFCTAPGAASTIEELHAMGCGRFLVCGGAGALRGELSLGEIVIPTAAVRDEGTSYHYLPGRWNATRRRWPAFSPDWKGWACPSLQAKPGPPTPSTGKRRT